MTTSWTYSSRVIYKGFAPGQATNKSESMTMRRGPYADRSIAHLYTMTYARETTRTMPHRQHNSPLFVKLTVIACLHALASQTGHNAPLVWRGACSVLAHIYDICEVKPENNATGSKIARCFSAKQ